MSNKWNYSSFTTMFQVFANWFALRLESVIFFSNIFFLLNYSKKKGANVVDDFPISFVFFFKKKFGAQMFSKLLIYLFFLRLLISVAFHRIGCPFLPLPLSQKPQTCSSSKQKPSNTHFIRTRRRVVWQQVNASVCYHQVTMTLGSKNSTYNLIALT